MSTDSEEKQGRIRKIEGGLTLLGNSREFLKADEIEVEATLKRISKSVRDGCEWVVK